MTLKEINKSNSGVSVLWKKDDANFRKSYRTKDVSYKDENGNDELVPHQRDELLKDIGQEEYNNLKLGE